MTTTAFRMGDSVTNPITPLMVYVPLVPTFCQCWDPRFGMGGLIATMLPFSIVFARTRRRGALQVADRRGAAVRTVASLQADYLPAIAATNRGSSRMHSRSGSMRAHEKLP
jgi:hypothetical protein